MRRETVTALDRLNERFYEDSGDHFDETRQAPWRGWLELSALDSAPAVGGGLDVADLGCGNGRLASFLDDRGVLGRYVGIERSWTLVRACQARLRAVQTAKTRRLAVRGNLLHQGTLPLATRSQDLVACFGVLHHVPGSDRRRQLVERAYELVRPGGWLALSLWQFLDEPTLARRCLDAAAAADHGLLDLDLAHDLEETDRLIPWHRGASVRFCHHTTDQEAAGLVGGLDAGRIRRRRADGRSGRLNLYIEVQRASPR